MAGKHRSDLLRARILRVLLLLALLLFAIVTAYRMGVGEGRDRGRISTVECAETQARATEQREEMDALRQQVFTLRKGAEIDQAAAAELRSQLAKAQETLVRLGREIELFRSIADPSVRTRGLALHKFELFRATGTRSYRYRVVFLQRAQKHSTLKGYLTIAVSGTDGKRPRTLNLDALEPQPPPGPAGRLPLDFIYFQTVEGEITLPEGFAPEAVRVHAEVSGVRAQRIDRTFDWQLVEA